VRLCAFCCYRYCYMVQGIPGLSSGSHVAHGVVSLPYMPHTSAQAGARWVHSSVCSTQHHVCRQGHDGDLVEEGGCLRSKYSE
jgi:hypothetical protein